MRTQLFTLTLACAFVLGCTKKKTEDVVVSGPTMSDSSSIGSVAPAPQITVPAVPLTNSPAITGDSSSLGNNPLAVTPSAPEKRVKKAKSRHKKVKKHGRAKSRKHAKRHRRHRRHG